LSGGHEGFSDVVVFEELGVCFSQLGDVFILSGFVSCCFKLLVGLGGGESGHLSIELFFGPESCFDLLAA